MAALWRAGKTRLETIGVMVCAVIMSLATVEVIRESIQTLVDGVQGVYVLKVGLKRRRNVTYF